MLARLLQAGDYLNANSLRQQGLRYAIRFIFEVAMVNVPIDMLSLKQK